MYNCVNKCVSSLRFPVPAFSRIRRPLDATIYDSNSNHYNAPKCHFLVHPDQPHFMHHCITMDIIEISKTLQNESQPLMNSNQNKIKFNDVNAITTRLNYCMNLCTVHTTYLIQASS